MADAGVRAARPGAHEAHGRAGADPHADPDSDAVPRGRAYLRRYGIACRIIRRGVESSERLGRLRWIVERALAWLNQFRRLTVRYERSGDLHSALLVSATPSSA